MHPLDGPRVKVERANSQLIALQNIAQAFFETNPYTIVLAEIDRKTSRQSVRVNYCPAIPDEWGVIIGEICHDLRSALDLLVWQLALCKTLTPYKNTQFPIYLIGNTKRHDGKGNPIPHFWGKAHGRRYLQSVPRRFWERIDSFQPYKRGNLGRRNPLFLLQNLNNTDKHCLITVINPVIAQFSASGLMGGGSRFYNRVTLHPNTKIGYVMPLSFPVPTLNITPDGNIDGIKYETEVKVDFDLTPGIRFGDGCNAVKGLPVIRVLQRIIGEVSRIIDSFSNDF